MIYGWSGGILQVDLTAGTIERTDSTALTRAYLGGRALASRLNWDRLRPATGPYDPGNALIVATGPLAGTLAPASGRTVMAGISPRPYPKPWHTHSTLGGWFGPALKYAGLDALVIEGASERPVYLEIRDQEARLRDATDLWGLGAREVQIELKRRHGPEAQMLAIGPAGENLVRFATVQHAEENAAGHSGFGAVWGSKKLKAVVVVGTGGVRVAHPEALLREVRGVGRHTITPMNGVLRQGYKERKARPVCSQACTFNCLTSEYGEGPDGRRVPGTCIGNVWLAGHMRVSRYSGGGIEIPAGVSFERLHEGALHRLCNSLGLDLWFRLVMQPWLMRCRQLGIDRIRGYPLEPENGAWFEAFMHALARREGLGGVFAEDLARAMDELEGELPAELIRLGREMEFGFGFPAHREGRFWDEEPLPLWVISAMMYASESRDPTIGTHQSLMLLAGFILQDSEVAARQLRRLSEQVWGYPEALAPTFDRKAPVAVWSQHQHLIIDSLPLCDFAFPQLVRPFATPEEWQATDDIAGDLERGPRLLRAVTGVEYDSAQLQSIAERAFNLERAMLALAGRDRRLEETLASHFQLPCRADGTLVSPEGFSRLLVEYYEARQWDQELGWPTPGLLVSLGLDEVIPALARQRRAREQVVSPSAT